MTQLEYICESLLGPPNYVKTDGESYWDCPECGRDEQHFHTRPLSRAIPSNVWPALVVVAGEMARLDKAARPESQLIRRRSLHTNVRRGCWRSQDAAC